MSLCFVYIGYVANSQILSNLAYVHNLPVQQSPFLQILQKVIRNSLKPINCASSIYHKEVWKNANITFSFQRI